MVKKKKRLRDRHAVKRPAASTLVKHSLVGGDQVAVAQTHRGHMMHTAGAKHLKRVINQLRISRLYSNTFHLHTNESGAV